MAAPLFIRFGMDIPSLMSMPTEIRSLIFTQLFSKLGCTGHCTTSHGRIRRVACERKDDDDSDEASSHHTQLISLLLANKQIYHEICTSANAIFPTPLRFCDRQCARLFAERNPWCLSLPRGTYEICLETKYERVTEEVFQAAMAQARNPSKKWVGKPGEVLEAHVSLSGQDTVRTVWTLQLKGLVE